MEPLPAGDSTDTYLVWLLCATPVPLVATATALGLLCILAPRTNPYAGSPDGSSSNGYSPVRWAQAGTLLLTAASLLALTLLREVLPAFMRPAKSLSGSGLDRNITPGVLLFWVAFALQALFTLLRLPAALDSLSTLDQVLILLVTGAVIGASAVVGKRLAPILATASTPGQQQSVPLPRQEAAPPTDSTQGPTIPWARG